MQNQEKLKLNMKLPTNYTMAKLEWNFTPLISRGYHFFLYYSTLLLMLAILRDKRIAIRALNSSRDQSIATMKRKISSPVLMSGIFSSVNPRLICPAQVTSEIRPSKSLDFKCF